ncbi:hypothetical protein ACFY4H_21370 [Streptomyces althioticus]|uniref:hypothetical protein n=1 Tax=Streptomyces althioticus TaxID=83380 RepID=UPI0036BB29B2
MEPFRRPIEELPGDPRGLSVQYRQRQPLSGHEEPDGLDEWTVTARVERFWNRTAGGDIGSLTVLRLRQDERFGPDPWSGLEADAEYSEVFRTVLGCYDLGKGGYRQVFRDTMTSSDGDLLVLTGLRLDPEWRGFGLGLVFASQALWTLAGGCSAVAVDIRPPVVTDEGRRLTSAEWDRAIEKLVAFSRCLGFRRRPRPLGHLLDPASAEARDAREEHRRRYDALVDAWRAVHPR